MEMSKTSKYFILKTPLEHILSLFSKTILTFGTRSSSGLCFSPSWTLLYMKAAERGGGPAACQNLFTREKTGAECGGREGSDEKDRTWQRVQPAQPTQFHQRSGQKPLAEGLRRLRLTLPGQGLTKFNRHPPRAMPKTAAAKERGG